MAMAESYNNPKPGVLFHQSTKEDPLGSKTRQGKGFQCQLPKGECKKTLVRNTELTVYPTIYKSNAPVEERKEKAHTASHASGALYKTNLSAPCLNSALRLVKEMKQASRARPLNTQCVKLLDEGKVLQQVNFLYEEHLYHNLVALNVSDTDLTEASSSRITSKFRAREKDIEPQLTQFFTPSFSKEYCIPKNPPRRIHNHQHLSGNFSVYERMKSWNVD